MYFLILLGAVVSALKLMQIEPVVDWSWYSLSMFFGFMLLWSILASFRKNRKISEATRNQKDVNSNRPEQSGVDAWENLHEWERNRK